MEKNTTDFMKTDGLRILKIIHGYPPNYNAGSEVYSQSIVNELKKKHQITVFTREENEYIPDFNFRNEHKENVDFVYVNMARSKDGYSHQLFNLRFENFLKETRFDIAHIGHLNHLSIGIIDVLHKSKIPIVLTLHDFWLMCPRGQFLQRNFDGKNLFNLCDKQVNSECAINCYSMYFAHDKMSVEQSLVYECAPSEKVGNDNLSDIGYWTNWIDTRMNAMKRICEKIDLFVAPSRYLMNRFVSDFVIPKEKIMYLDYGFPTQYLLPIEPKTNGVFTFGYIGTHIPSKGINVLIEAFAKLKGNSKLKIFGREQGQNTQALKAMAKLSKNEIEFCGEYINQNLATTVFNHVNCIVVPSIWTENSPLVIHEAQQCRIPVITANIGGMAEYVEHQINGLQFEHRNAESLSHQMQWALENQDSMKKLGAKGYLYSKTGDVIAIEEHCLELENMYSQVIHQTNE